jgi:uncharacterized Zn-finger protein
LIVAAERLYFGRRFHGGSEDEMAQTIDPPEIIEVESREVSCDGGGALGHPRVFLNMGDKGFVECPYCDRRFVLKQGAHRGPGH